MFANLAQSFPMRYEEAQMAKGFHPTDTRRCEAAKRSEAFLFMMFLLLRRDFLVAAMRLAVH